MSGNRQTPTEDITVSTTEINFRPGFETHRAGTGRLSPYIGGEIDLALKTAKFVDSSINNNEFEIKGAWDENGTERGYFRFGLNFIMGFDFYIAKKLYLGSEVGYGLELINTAYIKFSGVNTDPDDKIDGGRIIQFGPNFNSSLRLGFVF